jgi:hypothetical protein
MMSNRNNILSSVSQSVVHGGSPGGPQAVSMK